MQLHTEPYFIRIYNLYVYIYECSVQFSISVSSWELIINTVYDTQLRFDKLYDLIEHELVYAIHIHCTKYLYI